MTPPIKQKLTKKICFKDLPNYLKEVVMDQKPVHIYTNVDPITVPIPLEKIHSLVIITMENWCRVNFPFKPGVKNLTYLIIWLGSRYLLNYLHHTGKASFIKFHVVTGSHAWSKITVASGASFQWHKGHTCSWIRCLIWWWFLRVGSYYIR